MSNFICINAIHVQKPDGISVRFEDTDQLVYTHPKKGEVWLNLETIINPKDLAPDGCIVEINADSLWVPSNQKVNSEERAAIILDLKEAALSLKTRFVFDS